jgi:hypothetical protein
VRAIRYAADNGADVINASWTTGVPSTALRTAIIEAGVPVVVAAGNVGSSLDVEPSYPTSWGLPNVLAVAAVDHTGHMPRFSSYSRTHVDLAAPGATIVSAVPGGGYARMSGTSQSAAFVSGALALALERHPRATPAQLGEATRRSIRPLRSMAETRSGGILRVPGLLDHLGTRVPVCATVTATAFDDVEPGAVHSDAIACLSEMGVTNGRTADRFGIGDGLARGQVATMVARTLEQAAAMPPVPDTARFTDVPVDSIHRDAIEALAAAGLVTGRTATTYRPGDTMTRAELAAITARVVERLAGGPVRSRVPSFADTVGHPDEPLLRKAATLRIVEGRDDASFDPDRRVRRDQAATMLNRMLDRLGQQGLLPAA